MVEVAVTLDTATTVGISVFCCIGVLVAKGGNVDVRGGFRVAFDAGVRTDAGLPHPATNKLTNRMSTLGMRKETTNNSFKLVMEMC